MTAQAPETADALWARLQGRFDDTPRTAHVETPAGQAHWPHNFGTAIPDIRTVVVHVTSGWPTHSKWDEFVARYTDPTSAHRGIGPHFYIAYDGTVFRILSENKECWHATYVNGWAIGVETGSLTSVAAPGAGAGGPWPNHWTALSAAAEDIPGAKFHARSVNHEILIATWTTNHNNAQADSHPDGNHMMLFSEAQYRSWALLARWLAEVWRIPRNFPMRPHAMRQHTWQAGQWRLYRQIVDADAMRDPHIRTQLQPPPINCNSATFESDVPATGLPHVYAQNVILQPHTTNRMWTRLFQSYRGFHGHGYSGELNGGDHNCPGAWFDWHRFARLVWDYWWYPFDLAQAAPAAPVGSGQPRRDYGRTDGALYEHYFDEEPSMFAKVTSSGFFPVGEETVAPHPIAGPPQGLIGVLVRMFRRYWGFWHGGMHFELDEGSPIYALAAGQVVAARLAVADDTFNRDDESSPNPSALFVLVRHEVFFQRGTGDRLDYDQEPTCVYSLYMHLGSPDGLNFTDLVDENPGWLNTAITMKKEYDLGLAFQAAHPQPAAQWAPHVARWTRRQPVFDQIITDLQAGHTVRFPEGEDAVKVALGDFLGVAGHLDVDKLGVHLEVFSADPVDDPWFEQVDQGGSASRTYHDEQNLDDVTAFINSHVTAPSGGTGSANVYRDLPAEQKATRFQNIALRSKSEWALAASDFPDGGWAPSADLMWWQDVVPDMNAALAADAASQLPADAVVWNYHPLGFMHWLNDITFRSEWPKYRVVDAAGTSVPAPARPPPRR